MPHSKVKENLTLASFDDIFSTNVINTENEGVVYIPLCELFPPEFHPFQVNDDDAMVRLTESVRQYGVIKPGLARSRKGTGYELLCGNRCKRACELAFNPAVELSYLSVKEQTEVVEAMTRHEIKPSLSQAVRLKKLKQDGKLTFDMIDKILSEVKKSPSDETASATYFSLTNNVCVSLQRCCTAVLALIIAGGIPPGGIIR